MKAFYALTGVKEMQTRLKLAGAKVGASCERGLAKAGLFLMRESQKVVPVQTGNLRDSAFIRKFGVGFRTDVVVGYTALYAAYVHEDLTKAHGRAFNIKHAEEIARAGRLRIGKSGRAIFKPRLKAGTAQGGMFPRGEQQQAKFLEHPAKENRDELLRIIANG